MKHALAMALVCLTLGGCTLIDIHGSDEGVRSDGFITGYATAGWPAEDSFLEVGLFDGRNPGALFMLNVWKLVRVEVGLVGFSVGVLPLDFGLGLLFYKARPPRYEHSWSSSEPYHEHDDDHGHDEDDD